MSAFDPAMSSGASTGFSQDAPSLPQGKFSAATQGGMDQGMDHGHRPNYQTLRVHNTEPPADAAGSSVFFNSAPIAQQQQQLVGGNKADSSMLRGDMDFTHMDPGNAKFDAQHNHFTHGPLSDMTAGKFTPYEPGQAPVERPVSQQQLAGAMATGMAIAAAGRSNGGSDGDPNTNSAEERNREALRAPKSLEDLAAAEGRAHRLAQERAKFYRNRAPGMSGPSMDA
jgi:hypothetical protein